MFPSPQTGTICVGTSRSRDGETCLTCIANERTFHAWLRLSMSLSATGVVIAQMSKIQHAIHPDRKHEIKYYVLGVPQAAVCQLLAMVIIVIGACRFFKQEHAIKRGQAHSGGWEVLMTAGLILAVRWRTMEI
jgi:uncharacterized membrane protein YidH (DUF202 family)